MSFRSPWLFVPTLYFQQGLPVIIIQQSSVVLYKNLGLPNDRIGLLTSLITWPWILKMLWSPLVDLTGTKRRWFLAMQGLVTLSLALAALSLSLPYAVAVSLAAFTLGAFASATHDIALDGYYMRALRTSDQAFFVGIRSSAFRLAMLFANGVLVMLAGHFSVSLGSVPHGWQWALSIGTLTYGVLWAYAFVSAPVVEFAPAQPVESSSESKLTLEDFRDAFRTFWAQPKAGVLIAFVLFYRFPESMLAKMASPFLLDPADQGGLGLSTLQVGAVQGQAGMLALTLGGLLGGIAISRVGVRRLIWPMAFAMNIPNLFYVALSVSTPKLWAVYALIAIDQFGYGFGMAAYTMVVMEAASRSRFATSHFAIGTGLMSVCAMLAGIASGYLQTWLGYPQFFTVVCLSGLPGILVLRYLPYRAEEQPA